MNIILNDLIKTNSSNSSNNSSSSSNNGSSTTTSSNDEFSTDEEYNNILYPMLQILLLGRKRHRIENFVDIVHSWTDVEFKQHLRLHRNTVMTLISMYMEIITYYIAIFYYFLKCYFNNIILRFIHLIISLIIFITFICFINFLFLFFSLNLDDLAESGILPMHSFGRPKISAEWSLLITLWFLSNTESYRTLSDRFNVSVSSIFRVIRRVIIWILTKLDVVIKWLEGESLIAVAQGFKNKRGISNCIGAIDGSHITILQK